MTIRNDYRRIKIANLMNLRDPRDIQLNLSFLPAGEFPRECFGSHYK